MYLSGRKDVNYLVPFAGRKPAAQLAAAGVCFPVCSLSSVLSTRAVVLLPALPVAAKGLPISRAGW